jgi:hypothetical protein
MITTCPVVITAGFSGYVAGISATLAIFLLLFICNCIWHRRLIHKHPLLFIRITFNTLLAINQ